MAIHIEFGQWGTTQSETPALTGPAILLLPDRARGARYEALPGMYQVVYTNETQLSESIAWFREHSSRNSPPVGEVNFVLQKGRDKTGGPMGGGGRSSEEEFRQQEGCDICSPDERADGVADDYQMGLEFLDAFKPDYLTLGNHDDRIWMHSTSCTDGMLREHCANLANIAEGEFRKRKIKWVPYHVSKYLQLPEGGPKLIHGFKSSVNSAKAHHDGWGSCLHGHVHSPGTYVARHIDGGMSCSVGCLADIDQMTYADRYQAKHGWRQGFLFGLINEKTGAWQAWHATNENGVWISPHGIL